MLSICQISGFYNRYKCVSRIIRFFLLQDYEGPSTLLLYNNGPKEYTLGHIELPDNKKILLINNNKELATGLPYKDTGTIFNDALTFIPNDVDICCFGDVDDYYFPNYISDGVKGMEKAYKEGQRGWKPYESWFKYVGEPVKLLHNTMEPSIFVDRKFLLENGMFPVTASYHMKWIDALKKDGLLIEDKSATPGFLYYWGGDDGVYKTSSTGDSLESFQKIREWEADEGLPTLLPCSEEEAYYCYNILNRKN